MQASEEGYRHFCPLFHSALVGCYLDVSIRLRQAGDLARTLERRDCDAIGEPHGVELVTAGWGVDGPAERHAHGARREEWQAGGGAEKRDEQDVSVRQTRRWVSGHAEEWLAVDVREGRGLAGLHRDAMKDD